ncbi:MAG TPA: TIM barrel protein, partial [bacterium]|nr:TIM barrel protein [bacterium]
MSTSWNAARQVDGRRIVEEILELGFRTLEVDYRVTAEAAREIRGMVASGRVTVGSVHNFSPLAPGELPSNSGGHKLSLATTDEEERRRAVRLTLVSATLASDLGARVLVLHLGETDIPRDRSVSLGRVVRAEGASSPEAVRMRSELAREREASVGGRLDAAARSLEEILRACGRDLVLGIENRNYYHQIPLPEEAVSLIERVGSPQVRYWHDVGHAHALEALGFLPHLETLESMVPYLGGMHLHDAVFTADHKAPGTGEIDFASILALVPGGTLKVLELAPAATREEILAGLEFLQTFGVSPRLAA